MGVHANFLGRHESAPGSVQVEQRIGLRICRLRALSDRLPAHSTMTGPTGRRRVTGNREQEYRGMCSNDMKPGPGPEVVASLKELAGRGAGSHGIIRESGGVSTEYRLDGGEVRSRCLPTTFEDAMRSRLAGPAPKPENELAGRDVADLDGIGIAIRDASRGGGSAICASLLEKIDAALPTPGCPTCGRPMERRRKTGKTLASRPGPVKVVRTCCRCRRCAAGHFPLDRALGPEGRTTTPGAACRFRQRRCDDGPGASARKPGSSGSRWSRRESLPPTGSMSKPMPPASRCAGASRRAWPANRRTDQPEPGRRRWLSPSLPRARTGRPASR